MKEMVTRKETMKNITEAREKILKDVFLKDPVLWGERCFCLWLLSRFFPNFICFLLIFTSLVAIIFFFFLTPNLSSTGLSGFDGFLLFCSDGFMFLSSLHETSFVWRRTVFGYLMDRLMDMDSFFSDEDFRVKMDSFFSDEDFRVKMDSFFSDEDFLVKSDKPRRCATPPPPPQSTELREIKEDWCLVNNMQYAELGGVYDDTVEEEDALKEVEKTRRLIKEFREDGKKMDIEMEFMEHMIHSNLETHGKNLSTKLIELGEELREDEKKMKTYKELMKKFGNSELVKVVEGGSKASGEEVKSVAEEVHETYLVIQETAKAAKTTAERVNLTYLAAQSISTEIKSEALEGFPELREEVRRISLDFAARSKEAKAAADKAAKELSRATVELVEAVGIRQCDEYKTD